MYKKVKFIKVNLQTKNKSGMHALCTSILKQQSFQMHSQKEQKTTAPCQKKEKKIPKSHHYFLLGDYTFLKPPNPQFTQSLS